MSRPILTDYDFGNTAKILNLPDPTDAQHPATKNYVDTNLQGLAWKDNVRVASTANINLTSPGTTIDGVTMSTNDLFLAKDQSDASENGIYVFNGPSTPATRAPNADSANKLLNTVVSVTEGTTNTKTTWRLDTVNITLDTTDLSFVSFGTGAPAASTTTAGIIEIATQTEVNTGTDTVRAVTPDTLANWSGRFRTKTQNIGDGSATQYDITHNWGTRDVVVEVYKNSGNYDKVECDVTRPDTNTVRLNFASAPSSNAYRAVLGG